MADAEVQGGLSEAEKRDNVLRLAFGGDPARLDEFCRVVEEVVPPGTTVVLRGSVLTGWRWDHKHPFDAGGPGTSDLDLTLVGDGPLAFFKATGFFVPGVHSRPLSDDDPDIAPDLVPLRQRLMAMVNRPVNIQASREIVIQVRGDLIGQPYLELFRKPDGLSLNGPAGALLMFRLMTYNIRHGGRGREALIAAVINACAPDLVLLQEATDPGSIERIAGETGMEDWRAYAGQSLGFLSRTRVAFAEWTRPRVSRHAFIEVVPAGGAVRVFGVHLAAVHAAWTEQRRVFELRALLRSVARHQAGFHVLSGDFNTLAPGEQLDVRVLPLRLRPLVWMSGGHIRWRTVQTVLDAGYVDGFRMKHADDPGLTLPTPAPHIRIDYVFVPAPFAGRVTACDVVRHPQAAAASDHFPVIADLALEADEPPASARAGEP